MATPPTYQLKADDIPAMIESPQFAALPHEKRVSIAENALTEGADGLAGTWDRDTYQKWGQFANKVREKVSGMESGMETAGRYAKVAGGAIKDMAAIVGTQVTGLSPVLPNEQGGVAFQVPGETTGPMVAANVGGLVTGAVQRFTHDEKPLLAALEEVKTGIDDGAFFDHPENLPGWLQEMDDKLRQQQKSFYQQTGEGEGWAEQNSLLGSKANASALNTYLRTRSPQAWDQLRAQLLQTPGIQQNQQDKAKLTNESTLGKAMTPEARGYIQEASDPVELASTVLTLGAGKALIQPGKSLLGRAGSFGAGVAAEMSSEQISAMMDNPYLTWQQRTQIAKDSLAASLGIMGAGAGLGKVGTMLERAAPVPEVTPETPAIPEVPTPEVEGSPSTSGPQPAPAFRDDPFSTPVETGSGNLISDYGIAKTPEAQAIADAAELKRQQQQAKLRGQEQRAGNRMPMIPDSPLGVRDILDFVNDNPLYIPRKGTEAAKRGENDWRENWDLPQYYRKFLASSERGHNAADLAHMAFEEGYIQEPTPDALMSEIQNVMQTRTQYRVEFRKREKALVQEAQHVTNFEKSQAQVDDKTLLDFSQVETGDELTIDGHETRIKHVTYDEDGYLTNVVIEDGKAFGVLSLDPQTRGGIFVDDWKPKGETKAGEKSPQLGVNRVANDVDWQPPEKAAVVLATQAGVEQKDVIPYLEDRVKNFVRSTVESLRRDNLFTGEYGFFPAKLSKDGTRIVKSGRGLHQRGRIEVDTHQAPLEAAWVAIHEAAHSLFPTQLTSDLPAQIITELKKAVESPIKDTEVGHQKHERLVSHFANWYAARLYPEHTWPLVPNLLDAYFSELLNTRRPSAEGKNSGVNQPLKLSSATPEQLQAEKEQARQRAAIAEGQERQLKGDAGEFGTPDLLDRTAGDMALFNQTQVREQVQEDGSLDIEVPLTDDSTLALKANGRPAVAGPLPSLYSAAAQTTPPQTWSGKIHTLHGIRKFLLNQVGLPAVGVGRFQRALAIYKVKPEVIRLQAINDLPALAHEVGHHIHYKILTDQPHNNRPTDWQGRFDGELLPLGKPSSGGQNYTPDQFRKEGVAEFLRLWLTEPAQAYASAPTFGGFFKSELAQRNPRMAQALDQAREMIADYVAMPAFHKAQAQIVFDPASESIFLSLPQKLETAYTKWVDTLHPALKVLKQAANLEPSLANEAGRVATWMENHRGGWSSKAHADIFGNQTNLEGKRVGKGLKQILAGLKPGEHQAFSTYLALKRAAEIEARGMRSGFENGRLPASEMKILEQRFEPIRQQLQKWSDQSLNLLVDSGLLDAKSVQAMRQANRDYVPFYRLYEKLNGVSFGPESSKNSGGYVDLNSGIRRLKGSDLAIIDPLQSLMKNAFMFRKIAEQNHIGVQFFELMKQVQGHGQWGEGIQPKKKGTSIKHEVVVQKLIDEGVIQDASQLPADADLTLRLWEAVTKPDTKNGEVIVFKNGQREHWQIKDPLLMEALKTADADAVKLGKFIGPTALKALTLPTRALRFGATGGPWFAIPNFIRDQFTAGLQSKSGLIPFWDGLKGIGMVMKKEGVYERWIEAGGKFHGITTGTEAFTSLLEDALPKERSARQAMIALGTPRNWISALGAAGQILEEATRVAEFARMEKQGATPMEAANASKVISLNFARAGERSRVVNMLVAFANVQFQQLDMVIQMHRDPTRRAQVMMKGLTMITIPSVLCWMLGKDDEEIQNLPDWRKNMFWNLNLGPVAKALGMGEGFILSIPKPFLMGAIYGTSVERMLDYATGRDPNGWKKALTSVLDQTLAPLDMSMSIAGLRPILEASSNYDRFRKRPIVPEQMQDLPPENQYDLTTSETAKLVGRWTGQSPMHIDHLLQGYFATAAKWGTGAIDWGLAKLGAADVPPAPALGVMELPILNRFAGSPYAANAFVGRFYEASKDMTGLLKVWNKQSDQMTTAEQARWWKKHGPEILHYDRTLNAATGLTGAGQVRKAQASLSELTKAMKEVQASRVINPEVKRERLIELSRQRNLIAEDAFKTLFPEVVRKRHH